MRGLPRMLMMFAPMIFRAVSKYYKNGKQTSSSRNMLKLKKIKLLTSWTLMGQPIRTRIWY